MPAHLVAYVLDFLVAFAGAAAVYGYWLANRRRLSAETLGRAEEQARAIVREAEREGDTRRKEALLDAKERAHDLRVEAEQFARDHRQQITGMEQVLARREASLAEQQQTAERRLQGLERRALELEAREQHVTAESDRYARLIEEHRRELERVAALTRDEAREQLRKEMETDARREAASLVTRIEHDAREQAADKARAIVTQAIQRSAADTTVETTVTVVDLPSDEMKGRIIGREGRNIRAIEQATGVDLIVDDTPGAIILSGFDPWRREVARRTIERLIADGRIHPARIEEVVEAVKGEMIETARKDGEAAAFELGLHDVKPELLTLMGRLRYRTSYGQNILNHSKEVAYLAGVMASELNLDPKVARRAGLLHDIGKATSHEAEGSHTQVGADVARRHGEPEEVVNAIAAHHGDVPVTSLYTPIVGAADAVSGARPGARRESIEHYVKRLAKLEEIADAFAGVEKSYAIQAGREIRVIVSGRKVDDEQAKQLAFDISRRLEKEIEYPGQIKVVVIRETRAVEYAK